MSTTPVTPITLVFHGMPPTLITELQEEIRTARSPVFAGLTHIEIIRHAEGLVFRLEEGKAGYTFCRNSGFDGDIATFRHFLHDVHQSLYMPIAYEIKTPTEEVVQGILEKYQAFGSKHAAKIDWIWHEVRGRHLLILRIPKEIVRGMMLYEGGTLSTTVRGPVAAIRNLPVLGKIVPEDAKDGEIMHRAFVTTYAGAEHYEQCRAIHHAAVREVIGAGPLGITIGPVEAWTP